MPNSTIDNASFPYAEQYVGVWAIMERNLNALVNQAQNVNVQLHLQQAAEPQARAEIEARGRGDYEVSGGGVAMIELHGSLAKHASSYTGGASMVAARRAIRAAVKDPDVSSILLHIDSPGGTVAGTIDLADDVAAAAKQKPVHAYIEDLGASAAYWIASQATKVYANRSAQVGSIGVFSVITDWSEFAEKEGAKVNVVRFGQFKGAGVGGTKITDEQLAEWQKQVDAFGAMFVDAIATGRQMSKAQAKQLADGRVHTAVDAIDLKLIDGVKTLDEVHAELAAAKPKSAKQSNSTRSEGKTMSDTNQEPQAPQAATLADLKQLMPKASSDFLLGQLEASATSTQALQAYNDFLAEENERLAAEREEADKRAADAAKNGAPVPGKKAGNAPLEGGADNAEPEAVDYLQMAKEMSEKEGILLREASRKVMKNHPEAHAQLSNSNARERHFRRASGK